MTRSSAGQVSSLIPRSETQFLRSRARRPQRCILARPDVLHDTPIRARGTIARQSLSYPRSEPRRDKIPVDKWTPISSCPVLHRPSEHCRPLEQGKGPGGGRAYITVEKWDAFACWPKQHGQRGSGIPKWRVKARRHERGLSLPRCTMSSGVALSDWHYISLRNPRYGKGNGIMQQRCLENRIRSGIQVWRVLGVLTPRNLPSTQARVDPLYQT